MNRRIEIALVPFEKPDATDNGHKQYNSLSGLSQGRTGSPPVSTDSLPSHS